MVISFLFKEEGFIGNKISIKTTLKEVHWIVSLERMHHKRTDFLCLTLFYFQCYLNEIERDRKEERREREMVLPSDGSLHKYLRVPELSQDEAGAQNSIQVSHVGGGAGTHLI